MKDDFTIKEYITEFKTANQRQHEEILRTIHGQDKKFASKWIEKLQWIWLSGAISWMLVQVLNMVQVVKAFIQ